MAQVNVFLGRSLQDSSVHDIFLPWLEKRLGEVSRLQVRATDSSTTDCTPSVIIALTDFGGKIDLPEKLHEAAREVARQHFGVTDDQISVTVTGTFVG